MDGNPTEAAAREYAWNWFEYHAGQRQTVFRFFLILVGAAAGGYLTVLKGVGPQHFSFGFGILLIILAFLFWRLDKRSRDLIDSAEKYLREDEAGLSTALKKPNLRISHNAHELRKGVRFPLYTFKEVYASVFLIIALSGLAILLLDPTSPIHVW